MMWIRALLALAIVGCSLPPIKVETPEPLAVDINMRVDIYQHDGGAKDALRQAIPGESLGAIEKRRRDRMEEIQTLKNNRLVGEDHEGLLALRNAPPGKYGRYVRETVRAENADRTAEMKAKADEEKKPLADVQKSLADLWRERAFPGEWIEVQASDGSWTWVQKAE